MIKNSAFDFAYDYLRFDASWLFEWDINDITTSTVKFYPFTEQGTSRTWWFKNDGSATIQDHDAQLWDAMHPWLEYDADDTDSWDAAHPSNTTRYLSPGSSFITLTNSLETVVIDNVPPVFISDKGTEYIWICQARTREEVKRHCEFVFRDQAGLDFKNFEVKIGDVVAYKYNRKDDTLTMDVDENGEHFINPSSLRIASDGFHSYKVQFDLLYGVTDEELNTLNEECLSITVWDKAGNATTYTFGETGSETRKWVLIEADEDISELQPLDIKFYDHDPKNMIVDESSQGSVWVSIYNPNEKFYEAGIEIMASLAGDSTTSSATNTMGGAVIDMSTYDTSEYSKTGVVRFKIINIKHTGYVTVDAWLETGVAAFDDVIKTATFAEASCGPWIVMDADGRKYNIQRYVPKYLRGTEYFEFVKFFELYLNTVYTNMTKGTNVSILEKIAKIGDFNDIDRIEHALIWHYAKQRGMEFDIDLQTLQNLNLGFMSNSTKTIDETTGEITYTENPALNTRTEDDVIDIIKFALKNLPMYNQLKGSEKGMIFALKMFSMSCKVINLWCKNSPIIEENPNFIEENRLFDFTSHFLTSRFNLEFDSLNTSFPTFNDNLVAFVRFIKSIKPIVRILNLIKYTIKFEQNYCWLVNPYVHDDFEDNGTGHFEYTLTWANDEIDEMVERSRVDWTVMHANRIWINFNPAAIVVKNADTGVGAIEPGNLSNGYTLLATVLNESRHKFIFRLAADYDIKYTISVKDDRNPDAEWHGICYDDASKQFIESDTVWDLFDDRYAHNTAGMPECTTSFNFVKTIDLDNVSIKACDTGFYIYPKDGETATHLLQFVQPVYCLDDWRANAENAWRKLLLKQTNDETMKDYIENHMLMKINIIDSGMKAEMIAKLHHVPGTEICFFDSDVPAPSWL